MYSSTEHRKQPRIHYIWPLWYGTEENGAMHSAQVVDLCDDGISFKVTPDHCPHIGQHIFVSFSYPIETPDQFDMGSYRNWCQVIRIDHDFPDRKRVVVRLSPPLELYNESNAAGGCQESASH